MKVVLAEERDAKLILTDEMSESTRKFHGGAPVLVVNRIVGETDTSPRFPSDLVDWFNVPPTAAAIVADWANQSDRTAEELTLAKRFLKRWPEGPQLRTFWKCRNCGHDFFVRESLDLVRMWDDNGDVGDEVVKPMNSEYSCAECGHVYNEEGPFDDDE